MVIIQTKVLVLQHINLLHIVMANEISTWNKVVSATLKLPGVAVNRQNFLNSELKKYLPEQQVKDAIEKGTVGIVPDKVLDRISASCIKSHTAKVTLFSTAMGIPGGWAALGTVPTDIAQFYYHVLVVSQKLAYVYGYPDMLDDKGHLSKSALNLLTLFVGVMTGVGVAVKALQELGEILQKQLIKKLPEYALTNGVLYPAVRKVAKYIGMSLTSGSITKGVTKALPVISGLISGAITYKSFKPQARRLSVNLRSTMLLPQYSSAHTPTVDVDYEEMPPELPSELPPSLPGSTDDKE